jgi:hypothetical protein
VVGCLAELARPAVWSGFDIAAQQSSIEPVYESDRATVERVEQQRSGTRQGQPFPFLASPECVVDGEADVITT